MDIRNPQCHHHKLNIVLMRVRVTTNVLHTLRDAATAAGPDPWLEACAQTGLSVRKRA